MARTKMIKDVVEVIETDAVEVIDEVVVTTEDAKPATVLRQSTGTNGVQHDVVKGLTNGMAIRTFVKK
jgi:hypothetical protein